MLPVPCCICCAKSSTCEIGRRHRQGHEAPQGIGRDVYLRVLAALGAVVTGTSARLGCGLQRSTVEADRGRMALPASEQAQQRLHVLHDPLEAAGPRPAPHLLVRRQPRRKIMRRQPPLSESLKRLSGKGRPRISCIVLEWMPSRSPGIASIGARSQLQVVEPPPLSFMGVQYFRSDAVTRAQSAAIKLK